MTKTRLGARDAVSLGVVAGAIPPSGVTPSVLIIDDDQDVREYIGDVFELEGFDVTPLADPSVVVGRIRDEPFHIIVLDLMMPKIDGLDLLAQIRAFDEHISVIMVTGYPSIETISASMQLGISAYLAHPITPAELRHAIARIMKKKRFVVRCEGDLHAAIGQQIHGARKARGLTLEQMARRTNLPVSLLSQIERAETSASMSGLFKIATVLNLRLARLFAGY
jgi:DNA-binding NtrC family response regulator